MDVYYGEILFFDTSNGPHLKENEKMLFFFLNFSIFYIMSRIKWIKFILFFICYYYLTVF